MDVAVVVGELALLTMAHEAGEGGEQPNPDAPGCFGAGDGLGLQAEADGGIDGEEPHIAGETVEDAAPTGLLAGHAGELPVGTVVEIGPDEQGDADERVGEVGPIEADTCRGTEDDAEDGDHIGVDIEMVEEAGPEQTQGTREVDVEPLFGVARLEGAL